jgi:hypothetical protein
MKFRDGELKNFGFKSHVSSGLKFELRGHQKKGLKKLVKANKGATFAPAMAQTFFSRLTSKLD